MPQHHDIGFIKRHRPAKTRTAPIDGTGLALKLVQRGLAEAWILDPAKTYYRGRK